MYQVAFTVWSTVTLKETASLVLTVTDRNELFVLLLLHDVMPGGSYVTLLFVMKLEMLEFAHKDILEPLKAKTES